MSGSGTTRSKLRFQPITSCRMRSICTRNCFRFSARRTGSCSRCSLIRTHFFFAGRSVARWFVSPATPLVNVTSGGGETGFFVIKRLNMTLFEIPERASPDSVADRPRLPALDFSVILTTLVCPDRAFLHPIDPELGPRRTERDRCLSSIETGGADRESSPTLSRARSPRPCKEKSSASVRITVCLYARASCSTAA